MIRIGFGITFLLAATAVLILMLMPATELPDTSRFSDKLIHAAVFSVLSFLLYGTFRGDRIRYGWKILMIFGFSVVYGGLIEYTQQYTGRNSDWYDFLADLIGALITILIAILLRKSIERVLP
jgi:VanZ family protein